MKNSLEFDAVEFDEIFFYKLKPIFPRFFFRPIVPEFEILSVQKPPIIGIRCICFELASTALTGKISVKDSHVTDSTILIGQGEKRARFFYEMSKASPTRKMILIG